MNPATGRTETFLHLSAVDYGGAGEFTLDCHRLLQQDGHRSFLVVKDKKSRHGDVISYPDTRLHRWQAKLLRRVARFRDRSVQFEKDYYFYNCYEELAFASAERLLGLLPVTPTVIFVHWVTDFINSGLIGDLQRLTGARVYWLMIDNAPITGGCHYPWECAGYQTDCSDCPAILSRGAKYLAAQTLALKLKNLPVDLTLLAFSQSDYVRARKSAVFQKKKVARLLGFVDERTFLPGNKASAQRHFGIPPGKKVIFFGASSLHERRKGMALLIQAIERLGRGDYFLLIAGSTAPGNLALQNAKWVGSLSLPELVTAYQAAHVFVCASLEDSGPMMINQALMSGTPVVAFDTGVAQDLVHRSETGYRARVGDSADLALGIREILSLEGPDFEAMSYNCRKKGLDHFSREAFLRKIKAILYPEAEIQPAMEGGSPDEIQGE